MGSGVTGSESIEPVDGWVTCSSNAAGIEGAFFTFGDGTSTITPDDFSGAGSEICVSGEVAQVVDGDYSVYGAGVGFNFADEQPYDAASANVTGVSFNISALPTGTDTRIIFTTASESFCAPMTASGAQEWHFSDTTLDCWDTGGASPPATGIVSVQWQVTTNASASYPFNFCITDFAVIN